MTIDESARALGAPLLRTIGGKDFLLSPMTPSDWVELRRYVRDLASANTQDPLAAIAPSLPLLSPEDRAAAIKAAVEIQAGKAKDAKTPPNDGAVAERLESLDGVRYAIWLQARKAAPAMTLADVAEAVTDSTRNAAFAACLEVNGQVPTEGGDPKASGRAG